MIKKKLLAFMLVVVISASIFAVSAFATNATTSTLRSDTTFEFTFTPPFAGSMQRYNGTSMSPSDDPFVRVDYFLDANGDGTTNSSYYQSTCFVLQKSTESSSSSATHVLTYPASTGTKKSFEYYSGYGVGSSGTYILAGYPASQSFSAYGVNGIWKA